MALSEATAKSAWNSRSSTTKQAKASMLIKLLSFSTTQLTILKQLLLLKRRSLNMSQAVIYSTGSWANAVF